MSIEPRIPQRPLYWSPFVDRLSQSVSHPERVYLVGGAVRDALRERDIHDFDLATLDSGREVARRIANQLGGKYYTLDEQRDIGRAIVPEGERLIIVDVASFRGETLLDDLLGRDFTINAMAVCLNEPEMVIDPLEGQKALFAEKVLRPCSETSVDDDPVRAFRAIRSSLQFGLRMEPSLVEAVRRARPFLFDDAGMPSQPERTRDELFKLLDLGRSADALRILNQLGLLEPLGLLPDGQEGAARRFTVSEALSGLLHSISPKRDDNSASDLYLGTAVMVLDRYRAGLQEYLSTPFPDDRQRGALLTIASMTEPGEIDWRGWAAAFSLSNPERQLLTDLTNARVALKTMTELVERRAIYRYFKRARSAGVDGVLIVLAEYLAANMPTPNAVAWGNLLEHFAAPILDAYFNRYEEVIAPVPLLSGDDIQQMLGVEPGPALGKAIGDLQEAQAAGEITTQKEALQFVKRLLKKSSS